MSSSADPARPLFWGPNTAALRGGAENKRGYKWAYGRIFFNGMNTILPPNREVCMRQPAATSCTSRASALPAATTKAGVTC